VAGETLTRRLDREGTMSPDEALPLVRQMASALSAAHRAGVVHRDFKCSNVMLVPPPEGLGETRVVITDFGLARPASSAAGSAGRLTEESVTLGTADYMAPEQAQGGPITPATDIYALGVVLYEMVTGKRPHPGETPLEVLLKRLRKPAPSPRAVVPGLGQRWDETIRRCLAVDPSERYADALDVPIALGDQQATDSMRLELGLPSPSGPRPAGLIRPLIAVGAIALAVLAFWLLRPKAPAPAPPVLAPVQLTTWPSLEIDPGFSPDGGSIVFCANRTGRFEIYVRQLAPGSRELQLTSDGEQNFQPAWSPDGRWIAFASHGRGGIWLIPALGGTPRRVTGLGSHPAWSPDGRLVAFQTDVTAVLSANAVHAMPPSTLAVVSVDGGEPKALTRAGEPVGGHGAPAWSPDGRRLVFTASDRRRSSLYSIAADGTELRPVVTGQDVVLDPAWCPKSGCLYYSAVAEGERYGIWRIAVEGKKLTSTRPAEAVVSLGSTSIRHFAVSPDGLRMVYTALTTVSNLWSLPLVPGSARPAGAPMPLTTGSGRNSRPVFSPDGARIAFDRWQVGTNQDIWTMVADGSGARQATLDPETDTLASWLPGGRELAFSSERGGAWALWRVHLTESEPARLAELGDTADFARLAPGGERLVYHATGVDGAVNLWVADVAGIGARKLTHDRELMGYPCWSPDGEWLAFEMKRGKDDHVMLVASGGGEPRQLTSEPGKSWPFSFSPDGDKIAFAALRDGFWNIWWVSRSTGEQRRLTAYRDLAAYVRYPAWSPRDDQIVFERAETTGDLWMVERRP